MIHTAYLKGMVAQANKKLYYSFGDSSTNDFSKEYVFNVPPVRGSQPRSRWVNIYYGLTSCVG